MNRRRNRNVPNANIFGFGAVNGWTMICAERPLAAANEANFTAVQTHLGGSRARVRGDPIHALACTTRIINTVFLVQSECRAGQRVSLADRGRRRLTRTRPK